MDSLLQPVDNISELLENSLTRIDTKILSSENVITTKSRNNFILNTSVARIPNREQIQYFEKYSKCITVLRILCSALAQKPINQITEKQRDVVHNAYLFTDKTLRNFVEKIQPGEQTITEREVKTVTKELLEIAKQARKANLFSTDNEIAGYSRVT